MDNIFNKGLDIDDQKEEPFKRLEKIKDKNEELLKVFSTSSKVSKPAKNKRDFNYDRMYAFYRFYRDFEKFERMVSLNSKQGALTEFYKLLSDFKNHKVITNETKNRENRILNNVNQLYNKYFDTCKTNYKSENLNDVDEKIKIRVDWRKKWGRDAKTIMVWNK